MTEIIHKDILGNVVKLDDMVLYPDSNQMGVGKVTKLNNKMLNILPIKNSKYTVRKYPHDTLVVDDPKMTIYMLKNCK